MGRRCKLTPEVEEPIIRGVERGYSLLDAAAVAGVHAATVREWRRLGKNGDPRYRAFYERVQNGSPQGGTLYMEQLREHAKKDPKALQFLLAKLYPDQFGDHRPDVEALMADERRLLLARLRQRLLEDVFAMVASAATGRALPGLYFDSTGRVRRREDAPRFLPLANRAEFQPA